MPPDLTTLARAIHAAAVRGAEPGSAVRDALAREPLPPGQLWIVAVGKAALPMARAAVEALGAGREPAGGLVVAPEPGPSPHPAVEVVPGDHPVPGGASAAAALRLAQLTTRVGPDDVVLVLLSGGASALIGAPAAEVDGDDLARLYEGMLGAGADIGVVNAIRRRFTRFGGGRLAAALAPATVRCLAISDVAGDDPAAIGSGPCAPDPLTAAELGALIEQHGLRDRVPVALREHLALVERGAIPETPTTGDAAFARVSTSVILTNRDALAAAAEAARAAGCEVEVMEDELAGDAAAAGRACATRLMTRATERRRRGDAARPLCLLWGGETTVALPADGSAGRGGRCQELALAAAGWLHASDAPTGIVLLAAGTDGRDGPTDAAGAVVDGATWGLIANAGHDPAAALASHDSHTALAAADALVRTGHTGTNVRDVVVGLVT